MIYTSNQNTIRPCSIVHITRESAGKFIYGILLGADTYYFSKSLGMNDCLQLDNHPLVNIPLLKEMCETITELEPECAKNLSLELLNKKLLTNTLFNGIFY